MGSILLYTHKCWRWTFPWVFTEALPNPLTRRVQRVAGSLLSAVFPEDCRICERPLDTLSRVPVCESCLSDPRPAAFEHACRVCQTPFLHPAALGEESICRLCRSGRSSIDAAYSFGSYEGTLRRLIQLYKYEGVRSLAKPLAGFAVRGLPRDLAVDAVVGVPLHWRKRVLRGFDQSETLAQEIARKLAVPRMALLRRIEFTKPQAGLSGVLRRRALRNAFAVPAARKRRLQPWVDSGRHVLLIDDVYTTGSTAQVCARVLKRAGIARVTVLTVARVDRRYEFAAF